MKEYGLALVKADAANRCLVYVGGLNAEHDSASQVGVSELAFPGKQYHFIWPNQCGGQWYQLFDEYINAVDRAEEAGVELARCLAQSPFDSQDVYLIGHSLGTRVVGRALLELNALPKQEGWNEIRQVLLFNGAAPCHPNRDYRSASILHTTHGVTNFYNALDPTIQGLALFCRALYALPLVEAGLITGSPLTYGLLANAIGQIQNAAAENERFYLPIGCAAVSVMEKNIDISHSQGISHDIAPLTRYCRFDERNALFLPQIDSIESKPWLADNPEQFLDDVLQALFGEPIDPSRYDQPLSRQDLEKVTRTRERSTEIGDHWLKSKERLTILENETRTRIQKL